MITRISQAEVYSPAALGVQQLLVAGNRIAGLAQQLDIQGAEVFELEASGCLLVPGFVDSLAHIIGGGGEGGFTTRTSEMQFADAARAGVTTLVGVLGTDAVTRTLTNLLAKASAFNELGVTCYCYTGSYQIPARTLMADVMEDLVLIDKFIGVGEVAIADHRSSQPTADELKKLASQARVGGMLAGKAGIVSVHVGSAAAGLSLLHEVAQSSDIPLTQFYPTHINRNQHLLQMGFTYVAAGGYIDFTTSTTAQDLAQGEIKCADALLQAWQQGVNINNISFSSDANASLPEFDSNNNFIGLGEGRIASLYEEVADAIRLGVPTEIALQVVTQNPARILKLPKKGKIAVGADADLVLLDKTTLTIKAVMAQGRWLYSDGSLPGIQARFGAV
ncbi:MAG TPA: beta-aspartyl-peptidase [Rheinheimera sp.]|uniref:beta-aspartyl-peptidase n=1 Tax=Rheinheimera sp. TaxID=1869214 RepID=UPI000EEDC592|nr:beta-aspartyl-peptidase [Rheinheimera sp.]HCU64695.1 beta-aspartyl-peptidase [Rheinheimera sp.]